MTFPRGDTPELGAGKTIAAGVLWMRLPLPSSAMAVNVWAVQDGVGWDEAALADWLASLATPRERVPDDVLVLPAHGDPFRGLHARLDRLARKRHQPLGMDVDASGTRRSRGLR